MNKRITKRLCITFTVISFMVSGLIAQTHDGTAVPGAAADYASGAAQTSTYITEGTTVPVYALPDSYYHPSYNVGTSTWTLTDGFTWTWTEATTTLTFSQNNAQDNYVTISAVAGDAAGSPYTVNVTENAPAAYGGCSDAGTNLTVNVVTQPTFAINGGDATYSLCEGDAGLPANINTTIGGGWQQFNLAWTLEIATLDNASAKEFYYSDETGAGQNAVAFNAVEYTQANASFQAVAAATATHDIMTVGSFLAVNNGTRDATTVYTYTLSTINDRASRFGDFITLNGDDTDASAYTDYAATAASDQVIVTVYPAPVTGPIYHIDNAWAN